MCEVKLKVLLCSPAGNQTGGIAKWTKIILNELSTFDEEDLVIVLCPMNRSGFVNYNTAIFIRIIKGFIDYTMYLVKFLFFVVKYNPSIVHINTSGSLGFLKDIILIIISKLLRKETVLHFHFGRLPYIKKFSVEFLLLKIVLLLASKIVVIDKVTFYFLREFSKKEVFYLSNPLSTQFLAKLEEQRPQLVREDKTVLFVGHVIPTKGVGELIEVLSYMKDYKLTIAGKIDESYLRALETLISEKGLVSCVHFKGELNEDELIKLYLKSAIFVFPTYSEGFPNVILESLLAECPVISSSVGAIPEILEVESDFPLGLCIQPQSVKSLHEALIEIKLNYEVYLQKGKLAREIVIKKYHPNIIIRNLTSIYKN